jgi:hypothetical protein
MQCCRGRKSERERATRRGWCETKRSCVDKGTAINEAFVVD